jgi:hypothetical protein
LIIPTVLQRQHTSFPFFFLSRQALKDTDAVFHADFAVSTKFLNKENERQEGDEPYASS